MRIELDETAAFGGSLELAKRITRPRAVKILALIQEAREVIINTHPEPATLRATYASEWFSRLVDQQPEVIDPKGTIRFLQKIDAVFAELGLDDEVSEPDHKDADAPPLPEGDPDAPPDEQNPNDPDGF